MSLFPQPPDGRMPQWVPPGWPWYGTMVAMTLKNGITNRSSSMPHTHTHTRARVGRIVGTEVEEVEPHELTGSRRGRSRSN